MPVPSCGLTATGGGRLERGRVMVDWEAAAGWLNECANHDCFEAPHWCQPSDRLENHCSNLRSKSGTGSDWAETEV